VRPAFPTPSGAKDFRNNSGAFAPRDRGRASEIRANAGWRGGFTLTTRATCAKLVEKK